MRVHLSLVLPSAEGKQRLNWSGAVVSKRSANVWFNDVKEAGAVQSYELMPGLFDGAL